MIIPNIWKNKSHVPNHQPVNLTWLAGKSSRRFYQLPAPLLSSENLQPARFAWWDAENPGVWNIIFPMKQSTWCWGLLQSFRPKDHILSSISTLSMDWFCWENRNRKPSIFPWKKRGFPVKKIRCNQSIETRFQEKKSMGDLQDPIDGGTLVITIFLAI